VYVDCFTDVAVLAIDGVPRGRRAAVINATDEVQVGEPVGVFGHPLGLYFTGTRGIVSGKTDQFGVDLLQIDATVDHGNSGGPMIALRDGRVAGIATAKAGGDRSDRVNFATPMKDVNRILDLLRRGVTPSPAYMPFALLRDETGRHTLEVGQSFDAERWPLQPGDRIVAVQGSAGELRTLSELVTALRGRTEPVPLRVERGDQSLTLEVTPVPAPLVTAVRGVSVDGALISPIPFEDALSLREPAGLFVQSLESGSTAEILGLETLDILHSVNGRSFDDLDSLIAYLQTPREGRAFKVVLRRMSRYNDRWFDYLVRELPAEDVQRVGPVPEPVAATPE
jgi:S1-C subfamily serine protease